MSLALVAMGFCGAAPGMAAVTPEGDATLAASSSQDTIVGLNQIGTLGIDEGGSFSNACGFLGFWAGSTGTATVSGAGSTWTNSGELYVGRNGNGSLHVEAGGQVSSTYGYLGYNAGSIGAATVSGAGSTWASSYTLDIGLNGSGTLAVADGGKITAQRVNVNNQSTLRLHVSGDDMLILGENVPRGRLTNWGTVSLYADAFLPAGVYRPISAYPGKILELVGRDYKASGGTWDSTALTFTIAEPSQAPSGAIVSVTSGERLLVTDPVTGQGLGISFGTVGSGMTFKTAQMNATELAALAGLLGPMDAVRGAWKFITNLSGDEPMLSFDIGTNATALSIWRLDDGVWSAYTPNLLTHDANGIASFTVDTYSGYAISIAGPQWQGDGAATPALWSATGNWSTGMMAGAGDQAYLPQAAASKVLDLGGETQTVGILRFDSNDGYTIQNGALEIDNKDGAGQIISESGSTGHHTISAWVQIGNEVSIRVSGGRLSLSGVVSIDYGKTLTVVQAAADALTIHTLIGGTGTLSLADGTAAKLAGDSSIEQLAMGGSARLDLLASLGISGGNLASVNALVATGRNGGGWDGSGIGSSALASEAYRTLAVLADDAGVMVKRTWAGDLNGDGVVDAADYFVLDRSLLRGEGSLYSRGDVDYSGGIDGDDYFLIDGAYLNQHALSGAASGVVAVPEPGMLGVAAGLLGLLVRRRR